MKTSYIVKTTIIASLIGLTSLSVSKSKEKESYSKTDNKLKRSDFFMKIKTDAFTNFLDNSVDFSSLIENRADEIVKNYMDTVQNRVYDLSSNKGKQSHGKSLYQRFGSFAPAMNGRYAYCLWGERKSLEVAIAELNLDIKALPETNACPTMMCMMKQQNPESSFYGKIWEDKKAFQVAREKLDDAHRIQFDKVNIAADDIKPGSIYSTKEHTEMFLGRGKIVNRKFVADNRGGFYKIGFNTEMIRPVDFHNGKTNDIFIGNTYNLMIKELQGQVEQVKHMSRDSLVSRAAKDGVYKSNMSDNELKIVLLEELLGAKLNPADRKIISLIQWQKLYSR